MFLQQLVAQPHGAGPVPVVEAADLKRATQRRPAATLPGVEDEVWVGLDSDAGKQLLAEFIDYYQFRMGIESKDWPAIVEPTPSVTWDMTAIFTGSYPGGFTAGSRDVGLSYRDVEELLAERGVEVDHVTVYRWVQRFTPLFADAARFARHSPGDRCFVDETYVKVNGVWRYVYRAVDQYGQVIDVRVSKNRDREAARRFFRRALTTLKVTPDRGGHRRSAGLPMGPR
jgi:hypothetical protein